MLDDYRTGTSRVKLLCIININTLFDLWCLCYMYESLSMLFVSLCRIAQLFNFVFFLLVVSLVDEIKLLINSIVIIIVYCLLMYRAGRLKTRG